MTRHTTFWWVRHGPTHAKTMIGWTDLAADLSDGAALNRLAAFLPPGAPVISSDLTRARATADAIQGDRPRLPHDADLRELHFGAWEDRSFDEVEAEAPGRARAFWDAPGEARAPDGESWNDLRARVDAAAVRLNGLAEHVIVVAHMGAILSQVQAGLEINAREAFSHRIEPLSVTVRRSDGVDPIGHRP